MAGEVQTIYIPQVNDTYRPRDIQARLKIEEPFLKTLPYDWPPSKPLTGIAWNMKWKTGTPTSEAPVDDKSAVTVSIAVVPNSAIASSLDNSRPDFSSYKMMAGNPIVDTAHGLSRRINNRLNVPGGPVDELLTKEDGRFDFLIDCHDPGNEERRFCVMRYMIRPEHGATANSDFGLEVSVAFHRSGLENWSNIYDGVDRFVRQRLAFVSYGSEDRRGN